LASPIVESVIFGAPEPLSIGGIPLIGNERGDQQPKKGPDGRSYSRVAGEQVILAAAQGVVEYGIAIALERA